MNNQDNGAAPKSGRMTGNNVSSKSNNMNKNSKLLSLASTTNLWFLVDNIMNDNGQMSENTYKSSEHKKSKSSQH